MAITNTYYIQLVKALSPIISVGVGTTVYAVCKENGLNVENISKEDLPMIKSGIVEHYKNFLANKMEMIKTKLNTVV
ncbi:MAG: hypothetical protein KKH94_08330 [Candidatus Omnitrophica bacterium]|nr:hypothetical protein [Candidatus Omnitrophota bacterium]